MGSSAGKRWSREELLIAFNLYCRTPFGKLHKSNPAILELASVLRRSPSAVAMKLVNFASLDPFHRARNVRGLSNVSRADRAVWNEFRTGWEKLALESQRAIQKFAGEKGRRIDSIILSQCKRDKTETIRETRIRLVQGFFRETVLASYDYKCAICQLNLTELLNASHIIPWGKDRERRADPTNGLALCVIHDRAFDRGLFTLSKSLQVILSTRVKSRTNSILQRVALLEVEGTTMRKPHRFQPDGTALQYHRENIFLA